MNLFNVLFILSMLLGLGFTESYKVPYPLLEIKYDCLVVSIPEEPGIELVTFNISRNGTYIQTYIAHLFDRRWRADTLHVYLFDIFSVSTTVIHNQGFFSGFTDPFRVCTLKPYRCQNQGDDHDSENNNNNNSSSDNPNIPSTTDNIIIPQRIPPTKATKNCEPTVTEVPNRSVCSGELIFEDDFDTLNTSKWMHEVRAALNTGDVEFMLYDGEVEVKKGLLKIKPIQWSSYKPDIDVLYGHWDLGTRCTGTHDRSKECRLATGGQRILPPVVAPRINTRDSFSFKYGRVEIRAKIPQGDWLNPLLLLEPLAEYYGPTGFESGQLRVAFARGNEHLDLSNGKTIDGRILYGGAILFLDADRRDEFMVSTRRNVHFGNDFHIYSLTWTPEHLVLEVDNQTYGQILGNFSGVSSNDELLLNAWKRGDYMAPFDRAFYLTLGLSVGGFGDYPDNLRSGKHIKPWLNNHPKAKLYFLDHQQDWLSTWHNPELLVDYVRVYAL